MKKVDEWKTYLGAGFNLIPIAFDTKTPIVKWKEYQTRQLATADLIGWTLPRTFNMACLTGPRPWRDGSGIVVVDCDDLQATDWVIANLPETPIQIDTPKGGRHFYYTYPVGLDIRQRIKTIVNDTLLNIDIKATGNYVMAAGSWKLVTWQNESGTIERASKTYKSRCDPDQFDQCLKTLDLPVYNPEWFPKQPKQNGNDSNTSVVWGDDCPVNPLATLDGSDRECLRRAALTHLQSKPGCVSGKGAHTYLFAIACELIHEWGMTPDEAFILLAFRFGSYEIKGFSNPDDNVDEYGSYYPWSDADIRHKIRSAMNASPRFDEAKHNYIKSLVRRERDEDQKRKVNERLRY
jgi:hypothetical protein